MARPGDHPAVDGLFTVPRAQLARLLLQHDDGDDSDGGDEPIFGREEEAYLAAAAGGRLAWAVRPAGDGGGEPPGLAVALGRRLVVFHGGGAPPAFATAAGGGGEAATCLAWLAAPAPADEVVALGTSAGRLQLHAPGDARLLLRQDVRPGRPVLALHARRGGQSAAAPGADASEDLTLCFADAVARVPAWDCWAAARWARGGGARRAGWRGAGDAPELAVEAWSTGAAGPRAAAACLGAAPPPLRDAMLGAGAPAAVHILSVGSAPPVMVQAGAEGGGAPRGGGGLAALAAAAAAGLLGRVRRRAAAGAGDAGGADAAAPAAPAPAPAPARAALCDGARAALGLAVSPCGGWAAAADDLARVLLLDARTGLVAAVLKGYRGAQAAWLTVGAAGAGGGPGGEPEAGDGDGDGPGAGGGGGGGACRHLLVLYAPRRGAVELWDARAARRLGAAPAGGGAGAAGGGAPRVLLASAPAARRRGGWAPNRCFLLDPAAPALADLTPALAALAAPRGGGG